MKSPRNPRPYLRDILDSIERIRLYTMTLPWLASLLVA